MITRFSELIDVVLQAEPAKVAVAAAQDDAVLMACQMACEQGLARFTLFGDQAKIESAAAKAGVKLAGMKIIHEADDFRSAMRAVEYVSTGSASIVMKGMINTGDLLRAVLDKSVGLRTGRVLSHLANCLVHNQYYDLIEFSPDDVNKKWLKGNFLFDKEPRHCARFFEFVFPSFLLILLELHL